MPLENSALMLAEFMDLFTGNLNSYGLHQYNFVEGAKEAGKNSTVTNKLLTIEQYRDHLNGVMGLGVVPINNDGNVKFAVIDIDVYDADLNTYIHAIEENNFPLIPFKSKSGGLHIYMFLRQPTSAKIAVELLTQMVTVLALDVFVKTRLNRVIEIFPKQTRLNTGGSGNWINLPYYNAVDTKQYAIRDGKALSLESALMYIKERTHSVNEIKTFVSELAYNDGPPCLQTINLLGIMEKNSGRNNYLFSFGVYLKKRDPEFWEQHLFELNEAFSHPLSRGEVEGTIVNSLRKKEYAYKCTDQPCVDYCRKPLCKKRDYGIGKEGGYFSELEYGKMYQIRSYEPYYEWEVRAIGAEEFKRLRFASEADIIGQDAFLRLCVRELHMLPIKLKQSEWYKIVNQALAEIELISVEREDDTTPLGILKSLINEFLTDRAMAQTKEQIFNKRVYYDAETTTYYFRTVDLNDFLFTVKLFRYYTPSELHGMLRDFKATPVRIRTESGKQLRVYSITKEQLKNIGLIETEVFKAEFKAKEEQF